VDNQLKSLVGKTLTKIDVSADKEEILFICNTGARYLMHHEQSCCETVSIEEIIGDLLDLLNTPIIEASERINIDSNPKGVRIPEYQESFTWSFYIISTIKGTVTLRWYGSSNGYYSESVSIKRL